MVGSRNLREVGPNSWSCLQLQRLPLVARRGKRKRLIANMRRGRKKRITSSEFNTWAYVMMYIKVSDPIDYIVIMIPELILNITTYTKVVPRPILSCSKVSNKISKGDMENDDYDMIYVGVEEKNDWDLNDNEEEDPKTPSYYHSDGYHGGYFSED
ncbi:hypothetical protein FNV43_RR11097 [Rhamnella rubrinervis]|uniref:Uncharacterized protein n=1 Tax=Rhamnella rubrinervis TaxID=2594499 RepID=A0A8K0H5M2_9ROSA|nr:hypothetical protein FNV43_RR11097 [Rhamnella rubrinervis]